MMSIKAFLSPFIFSAVLTISWHHILSLRFWLDLEKSYLYDNTTTFSDHISIVAVVITTLPNLESGIFICNCLIASRINEFFTDNSMSSKNSMYSFKTSSCEKNNRKLIAVRLTLKISFRNRLWNRRGKTSNSFAHAITNSYVFVAKTSKAFAALVSRFLNNSDTIWLNNEELMINDKNYRQMMKCLRSFHFWKILPQKTVSVFMTDSMKTDARSFHSRFGICICGVRSVLANEVLAVGCSPEKYSPPSFNKRWLILIIFIKDIKTKKKRIFTKIWLVKYSFI